MDERYDEWDIGYDAGFRDGYSRGRYDEHQSASDTLHRAKLLLEKLASENDDLRIQIRNAAALLETLKETNEELTSNVREN